MSLPRNPLAKWENDDLLLSPEAQTHWRNGHPEAFRILDWPEMRAEFAAHDPMAGRARKSAQGWGTLSVAIAGGGVILGAVAAILPVAWTWPLALAYSTMVVAGAAISLILYARAGQRFVWLAHRYWTERIRQFQFQFILNHLDLAVRAMRDDAALAEFRQRRATAFGDFKQQAKHVPERIRHLKTDNTEALAWIDPDWAKPDKVPDGDRGDLDLLLDALRRLRIDVQTQYSGAKLDVDAHAPGTRAWWFSMIGDVSTALVAASALAAGLIIMFAPGSGWHPYAWAGVGVFGALGLMARVMEQGLQTSLDHERYDWYYAALRAAATRYAEGTPREKILALRDVEILAYQEMRRFIVAHLRAKFLM
jgi:hypothetical protein